MSAIKSPIRVRKHADVLVLPPTYCGSQHMSDSRFHGFNEIRYTLSATGGMFGRINGDFWQGRRATSHCREWRLCKVPEYSRNRGRFIGFRGNLW